jgi:hypothetical protein
MYLACLGCFEPKIRVTRIGSVWNYLSFPLRELPYIKWRAAIAGIAGSHCDLDSKSFPGACFSLDPFPASSCIPVPKEHPLFQPTF